MTQENENIDISAKQFFIELLKEMPKETVVWQTMSGSRTAENIIQDLINSGSDSKQYIAGLMRVARDILAARVNDPEPE